MKQTKILSTKTRPTRFRLAKIKRPRGKHLVNSLKRKQKKQIPHRAVSVVKHLIKQKTQPKSISKSKLQKKSKPQKSKLKIVRQPKEIIIHQEHVPQAILSDYIFAFELTRPYPTLRSYILKQPLKKPVKDILFELFGTKK